MRTPPISPLQFRFWNTIARRYQPASMYALTGEGLLLGRDEQRWDWEQDETPLDKTCIVVERWVNGVNNRGIPWQKVHAEVMTWLVGEQSSVIT